MFRIPLAWVLVLPVFASTGLPAACPRPDGPALQARRAQLTRALALGASDVEGLQLVQVKAGQWGGDGSGAAGLLTNVSLMTKAMRETLAAVRASHRMPPAFAEAPQDQRAAVDPASVPRPWHLTPTSVEDTQAGMRPSVATLWAQNVRLRREATRLREEMSRLHEQDAELRKEDTALRLEEAQLRHALAPAGLPLSASRPTLFSTGVSKMRSHRMAAVGLWIGLGSAGLALFAVLWCGACIRFQEDENDEDDESEDEDDEYQGRPVDKLAERQVERRLKALVRGRRHEGSSFCTRCCCCFNPQVAMFVYGVILVSVLLGAVTWQLGLLQPIIAQIGAYAYIAAILVCLVAFLVAELWRAVTTLIQYIILEFSKLKNHFKGGVKKAQYTLRDFLDDGKLNKSVPMRSGPRRAKTTES